MRNKPTNHTGWVVEEYNKEWKAVTKPTEKTTAAKSCEHLMKQHPEKEYRVYGAVK